MSKRSARRSKIPVTAPPPPLWSRLRENAPVIGAVTGVLTLLVGTVLFNTLNFRATERNHEFDRAEQRAKAVERLKSTDQADRELGAITLAMDREEAVSTLESLLGLNNDNLRDGAARLAEKLYRSGQAGRLIPRLGAMADSTDAVRSLGAFTAMIRVYPACSERERADLVRHARTRLAKASDPLDRDEADASTAAYNLVELAPAADVEAVTLDLIHNSGQSESVRVLACNFFSDWIGSLNDCGDVRRLRDELNRITLPPGVIAAKVEALLATAKGRERECCPKPR